MPGVEVQGGVVVAHPEGDLDALRVDEIHSAGQGNSSNPGCGRGKRAERAWEVLHVLSTLDVVDIGASELVVQRFDKLILDRLGHVLHLFIHYAASGSLA